MNIRSLAFTLCLCSAGGFPATGGLVYFAGTGHWYEAVYVPGGITWPTSFTNAVQSGGYLCTITSDAENNFVAGLVDRSFYSGVSIHNDILGPWLGGLRHANASWQWVTGEPFIFTKWAANQPDGYGGSEQRLQFYAGANVGSTWGDHPGDPIPGYSLPCGYIVEYNLSAPTLQITNAAPGFVNVSWSPNLPGFTLKQTSSLAPTNWTDAATGTTNPATLPTSDESRFFRLFKP